MRIGWVRTYTGKLVSLLAPTVEQLDIRDVAHHLAQEPRWGGACVRHYTVLEHSIWVARIVKLLVPGRDDLVLDGLLHDAEEAWTKDIQTPHKRLLGGSWHSMADGLRAKFRESLGLPGTPSDESLGWTKVADAHAAWVEAKALVAPCPEAGEVGATPPDEVVALMLADVRRPQQAAFVEASFLAWAKHLLKLVKQ